MRGNRVGPEVRMEEARGAVGRNDWHVRHKPVSDLCARATGRCETAGDCEGKGAVSPVGENRWAVDGGGIKSGHAGSCRSAQQLRKRQLRQHPKPSHRRPFFSNLNHRATTAGKRDQILNLRGRS